jgi:hypothetical protein
MAMYGWAAGHKRGGHSSCCYKILPPTAPARLPAKGHTLHFFRRGGAVTGPIGVHCLQSEELLALSPWGPLRCAKTVVQKERASPVDPRTGPSLLPLGVSEAAPGGWPRHVIFLLLIAAVLIFVVVSWVGRMSGMGICEPQGTKLNAHPDKCCVGSTYA